MILFCSKESDSFFHGLKNLAYSKAWRLHDPGEDKNIAPLVKEIVFNPLYILASFVEDKVLYGNTKNLE